MATMTLKEGTFCHIELPSGNLPVTKAFYGEVFGWTFEDVPQMNYVRFTTADDAVGGGLWNPPAGAPRGIVNYIAVEKIENALERITKTGGEIMLPRQVVEGFGAFALFRDPAGNVLGLFERTTL